MIEWGPRGYPGNQGLSGVTGPKGDKGDPGQGVIVTDNGNGSVTITGSNGSVILYNGTDGQSAPPSYGSYFTMVWAQVPTGSVAPTIDLGTGSYNGTVETTPTGSTTWYKYPQYTNGYTSYVSTNSYIHNGATNTWSLASPNWTPPTIFTINGTPVNRFTSYIFKRSTTVPNTPVGGSYIAPTPAEWSDGIPTGTAPVYMSKRLFTEDGNPPQDLTWSTPALMGAAGTETKFQFGQGTVTYNPTTYIPPGPDPINWHDLPQPNDDWMIKCTLSAGETWVCDYDNPVRIKGETGNEAQSKYLASAFKRSTTNLAEENMGNGEQPVGGSFIDPKPDFNLEPTGWSDVIPQGFGELYVSTRMFTSDGAPPQEAVWSGARLFSGSNASNFVLLADSNIFAYDTDDNISPSQIEFEILRQNIDEPTVWSTVPPITLNNTTDSSAILLASDFNDAEVTSVKVTATAGDYSDSTTIIKVADGYNPIPGIDYNDGVSIFVSNIYKAADTQPAIPTGGSFDGTNEIVPAGWSEDPIDPGVYSTVWVSKFTYKISETPSGFVWDNASQPTGGGPNNNGTGGNWSTPVKYVYVPQEGVDYFSGNTFLSYRFKNYPVGTSAASFAPTGGTVTTDPQTGQIIETAPSNKPGDPVFSQWIDDPSAPADSEVTWVTTKTYEFINGAWDNSKSWSAPSKFSGTAGITGVLTNENETINCDSTGIPTNENWFVSGEFKMYLGTSELTSGVMYSLVFVSPTGQVSASINSSTGIYSISKNGSVSNWANDTVTIKFRASYNGYAIDKILTLSKANNGNDGIDGSNGIGGISVELSNNNHSILADSYGTVVTDGFENSGTFVSVFEGGDSLSWTSSGTPSNSQWNVSAVFEGGILGDTTPAAATNNRASFGPITDMPADTGQRVFTVNGKTSEGVSFTKEVAQSFTKVRNGANGNNVAVATSASATYQLIGNSSATPLGVIHNSQGNDILIHLEGNYSPTNNPAHQFSPSANERTVALEYSTNGGSSYSELTTFLCDVYRRSPTHPISPNMYYMVLPTSSYLLTGTSTQEYRFRMKHKYPVSRTPVSTYMAKIYTSEQL